jgi:hypothetical protein
MVYWLTFLLRKAEVLIAELLNVQIFCEVILCPKATRRPYLESLSLNMGSLPTFQRPAVIS